jgi:hypothetical protein
MITHNMIIDERDAKSVNDHLFDFQGSLAEVDEVLI